MNTRFLNSVLTVVVIAFAVGSCSASQEDSRAASATIRVEGVRAAEVNGAPIFLSDITLEATAQGLIAPGTPLSRESEVYQTVLDQLVEQKLLAQEATRQNLHQAPDAQHRLNAARERILTNLLVESLVADNVTDEAVEQMYAEQVQFQQLDDEVRISLITVTDQETAELIRSSYEAGAEFSALAIEFSTDTSSRLDGGDLGFVKPTNLQTEIATQIANTKTGDVSAAFETDVGWHVLKVNDRRRAPPQTLEEMRPEIVTFLTLSEFNKVVRHLRLTGNISVFDPENPQQDTEAAE